MTLMEIFGFAGALVMGVVLGLIGGGGSILTVPILVYLFAVDTVLATAYSLFIVGLTSLVGSFSHMRLKNVDWQTALVFGVPSILSVYLTRSVLLPSIPEVIFESGTLVVNKNAGLLVLFAVIMLAAAYSMIRKGKKKEASPQEKKFNYGLIFLEGAVVGVITGLVGAGGGFLIIPALVLLAGLPMKRAVGTSLVIIAAKSLIGFTGDLGADGSAMDWTFLLTFSAIAIVGILVGTMLSKRISNEKLKPAFGWFVLVMGVYILLKETVM